MTEPTSTEFPGTDRLHPPQEHMDAVLECLRSLEPRDAVTAQAVAVYVGLSNWQTRIALVVLKQRGLAVSRLRGGVQGRLEVRSVAPPG